MRRSVVLSVLVAMVLSAAVALPATALEAEIWYPVQVTDGVTLHDNYGDCRGSGCSRTHRGVDIMAPQMTPVYAASGGYIRRAYGGADTSCTTEPCSSYGLLVYGDDGNTYFYLHLNNDTPERPDGCDRLGGPANAFSAALVEALEERGTLEPLPTGSSTGDVVRVETGDHIGYVGSSGNAGCGNDHLHFEMWEGHAQLGADDPAKVDPYPYVAEALEEGRYWTPTGRGTASASPTPPPSATVEVGDRVSGGNRVLTSVSLARAAFTSASTVVVAPAEGYPEALLSAPLAATLDAPVLLTWSTQLPDRDVLDPAVADEIQRLGATDAVIVGGTDTLGPELEGQLRQHAGITSVRRIAGEDRYEIARVVAEEVAAGNPGTISPIVALGEHANPSRGWPDALAASAVAAAQRIPILLTKGDELPLATRRFLARTDIGEVRIAGGEGAISASVEDTITAMGRSTRRLAGADRFETSLALAEEALRHGADDHRVWAATGHNYPDALAAGRTVAARGEVLVLVDGRDPAGAAAVHAWLRRRAATVGHVTAVGGAGVVTDAVLAQLTASAR
ncbi:MAG: cell wall-binding repeat-containing protein [Actinobacteria bacterium]|nr:cell wall-binding repeat-containing protein [Actinomycetota bacterium]